jgi:hypothetical protein
VYKYQIKTQKWITEIFLQYKIQNPVMSFPNSQKFYQWRYDLERQGVLHLLSQRYYDSSVTYTVQVSGINHAVNILSQPQFIYDNLESVQLTRPSTEEPSRNFDIQRLLELIRKQKTAEGKNPMDVDKTDITDIIWNNKTYTLTDISFTDNQLTLDTTFSDFYTVSSNRQTVHNELVQAITEVADIGDSKLPVQKILSKRFPIRDRLFPTFEAILSNISQFKSSIGLTTIIVIRGPERDYLLIAKRSPHVVTWPDHFSAIPSGFMQDSYIHLDSIEKEQFIDMYTNELFDVQNPTQKAPQAKGIKQLLKSELATFTLTGFGVIPLNITPQLSGICVIEYEEYLEYLEDNKNVNFENSNMQIIPTTELDVILPELFKNNSFTPTSEFALMNGLKYIESEYPEIEIPLDFEVNPE